jgi:hypothetical protein
MKTPLSRLGLALGLVASLASCSKQSRAPERSPEMVLQERVCNVLVASYRVGLRPSEVDVVVPQPNPNDPPARITLRGNQVPPAELCLGLPPPPVPPDGAKPAIPATVAPSAAPSSCPAPPSVKSSSPLETRI